ncbi:hypothetical protein F4777DRAFT_596719 [Nemania sp. FL0916]|nr:hypothetical protein F4777DRAFT_596719 [Nemania sp. FL0916]
MDSTYTTDANTTVPRDGLHITVPTETPSIFIQKMAKLKRWMEVKPKISRKGEHPPWQGYTGVGVQLDFKPEFYAYQGRVLADATILSFYPTDDDLNLTPSQITARGELIALYNKLKDREEKWSTFQMTRFAYFFDQFFFFGAMMKKARPRTLPVVWKPTDKSLGTFAKLLTVKCSGRNNPNSTVHGFTEGRSYRGYGPFVAIHLASRDFFSGFEWEFRNLSMMLATLVHEMVHAYLDLFLCRCEECTVDRPNTFGFEGHGPVFLMILDAIDCTLKSWDAGLVGLGSIPRYDFDEIRYLRGREIRMAAKYSPRNRIRIEPADARQSYQQSGNEEADGRVKAAEEDKGETAPKPARRHKILVYNEMRGLQHKEPGDVVQMLDSKIGSVRVDPSALERTCNTLQAQLKAKSSHKLGWLTRK